MDTLLANVHKQNVTRFPYEIARLAQDIAGGLMVTCPSEEDLKSPEVGKWVKKYLQGRGDVPTEHRMRILRLIENLTMGVGRGRVPHRVDARRRLAAGPADHDLAAGEHEGEAEDREEARGHHGRFRGRWGGVISSTF